MSTIPSRTPSVASPAVPLLLGVTGPQNIEPQRVAAIRTEIVALLDALRNRHPHTPLLVLSPLVAGADQIAAEAALAAGNGVGLAALHPWSRDFGMIDTARYGDAEHYRQLLDQATVQIEMPCPDGELSDLRERPDLRERQYTEQGKYIARHVQILIAVCDPETERPDSQTAVVVGWHRDGTNAPFSAHLGALDATRPTAIYYISPTGQTKRPEPKAGASRDELGIEYPSLPLPAEKPKNEPPYEKQRKTWWEVCWGWATATLTNRLVNLHRHCPLLFGHADHAKRGQDILRRRWRSIDEFNRDMRRVASDSHALQKSRGYVLPPVEATAAGPCIQRLLEIYARADVAALDYQRQTQRVLRGLFAIAAIAVATHETYAHAWHQWYVLLAYLVLVSIGYRWFRSSQRRDLQGRWLDLRALAETLRVQIFWQLAGRPECTADYFLRHFRGELDWIRHAARAIFFSCGGHSGDRMSTPLPPIERLQQVRNYWVVDQLNYFVNKEPVHSKLEIAFETAAKLAFFIAMAISGIHVAWHLYEGEMSEGLVLATFGCLVAAAMLEEFSDLQTYALTARKFAWMAELFDTAEKKLTQQLAVASDASCAASEQQAQCRAAQAVVFELGQETLAENADWVVQHRQRPPTLPSG